METYPNHFLGAHNSDANEPNFVVVLYFNNEGETADPVYFTHRACNDLTGAQVFNGCIDNDGIEGFSQGFSETEFFSTVGNIDVRVVDFDDSIAQLFADKRNLESKGLRNKRVEIYQHYADAPFADFILRRTYRVENVHLDDGVITLQTADIQRGLDRTILKPHTAWLAKNVSAVATHIPVNIRSASDFQTVLRGSEYIVHPNTAWSSVRLDDEIILHSGLFQHAEDGWSLQVIQRGAIGTAAAEHLTDADSAATEQPIVTEHPYIEGPAPRVLLGLLLGHDPITLENYPAHWCLNLPSTWVRSSDFYNVSNALWNTVDHSGRWIRLNGESNINAKDFIESQINPWLNCVLPTYANGELGLAERVPLSRTAAGVAVLNVDNVEDYGELEYDHQSVENNWSIEFDFDPVRGLYQSQLDMIDAGILIDGDTAERKLQLRTIHTRYQIEDDVFAWLDTARDRYAAPPLRLSLTLTPDMDGLELPDIVRVQLPIIDPTTGAELDRAFEVQQTKENWIDGRVTVELLASTSRADGVQRSSANSVADSAYEDGHTDLASVLTIINDVIQPDSHMAVLDGAYFYAGNLELPAGTDLQITNNTELWVRGVFTRNGNLLGKGRNFNEGAFGVTQAGAAYGNKEFLTGKESSWDDNTAWQKPTVNGIAALTRQSVTVNASGNPTIPYENLAGLPGPASETIPGRTVDWGWLSWNLTMDTCPGITPGGNGGAGLKIVCRGMVGSGTIDTSGDDGLPGARHAKSRQVSSGLIDISFECVAYTGSSGGGAPGAIVIVCDGPHLIDLIDNYHLARQGDSPAYASARVNRYVAGFAAWDYEDAARVIVYAQKALDPAENRFLLPPVIPPTALVAVHHNLPKTVHNDWATIEISVILNSAERVNIYYGKQGQQREYFGETKSDAAIRVPYEPAVYEFEIIPVGANKLSGAPVFKTATVGAPPVNVLDPDTVSVPTLAAVVNSSGITLQINGLASYHDCELREGADWATGLHLMTGKVTEITLGKRTVGTHKFWIKGINAAGTYSTGTGTVSVTITALALPTLTIRPGLLSVTVQLENIDPLSDGHKVWISQTNGFDPDATPVDYTGSDTVINFSKLAPNITYYVRVRPYSTEFGDSNNTSTQNAVVVLELPSTPAPEKLVFHWPLNDDPAREIVAGITDSHQHASSIDAITNTGPFGKSLTINSDSKSGLWLLDHITIEQYDPVDKSKDWTWEVMFRPDSDGASDASARIISRDVSDWWGLSYDQLNKHFQVTGSGISAQQEAGSVIEKIWYHLCMRKTGDTFALFVNGALIAEDNNSNNYDPNTTNGRGVALGTNSEYADTANWGSNESVGQIGFVKFWSDTLKESEIEALALTGLNSVSGSNADSTEDALNETLDVSGTIRGINIEAESFKTSIPEFSFETTVLDGEVNLTEQNFDGGSNSAAAAHYYGAGMKASVTAEKTTKGVYTAQHSSSLMYSVYAWEETAAYGQDYGGLYDVSWRFDDCVSIVTNLSKLVTTGSVVEQQTSALRIKVDDVDFEGVQAPPMAYGANVQLGKDIAVYTIKAGVFAAYGAGQYVTGVEGIATNQSGSTNQTQYGGKFKASGDAVTNYGIYAEAANAATNWAGYFVGAVYLGGEVTFQVAPKYNSKKLLAEGNGVTVSTVAPTSTEGVDGDFWYVREA